MITVARTAKTYLEAYGVHISNENADELAKIQIESARLQVRQQGSDYWNPFRYVGTLLGGTGTHGAKIAI